MQFESCFFSYYLMLHVSFPSLDSFRSPFAQNPTTRETPKIIYNSRCNVVPFVDCFPLPTSFLEFAPKSQTRILDLKISCNFSGLVVPRECRIEEEVENPKKIATNMKPNEMKKKLVATTFRRFLEFFFSASSRPRE